MSPSIVINLAIRIRMRWTVPFGSGRARQQLKRGEMALGCFSPLFANHDVTATSSQRTPTLARLSAPALQDSQ